MERKIPVRFVESDAESYKPHVPTREVVPPKDNGDTANQENNETVTILPTEQGAKHQQATSYEKDTSRQRAWWKWQRKSIVEGSTLIIIFGTLVATCQQNQVMRDTFRLDKRAWVGAVRVVESRIVEEVPLQLGVIIKGSGETPAADVKIRTSWVLHFKGQEFRPMYRETSAVVDSKAVIFPDMEIPFYTAPDIVPRGTLLQMSAGAAMLFHYGMIDYKDVFTPPASHCTIFCYVYTTDPKTPQICDAYNVVTDEKCIQPPAMPGNLIITPN